MKSMLRQSLPGPFVVHRLGAGLWQLTSGTVHGTEIFLSGVIPETADWLENATIARLIIEWRAGDSGGGDVSVELTLPTGVERLVARSVQVHQPSPQLYDQLPLASFDAAAQSFWKRVFLVMRLPGGRILLRFLAA